MRAPTNATLKASREGKWTEITLSQFPLKPHMCLLYLRGENWKTVMVVPGSEIREEN